MSRLHLPAASAAMAALLMVPAPQADAQQHVVGGGLRLPPPASSHSNHFSWEGRHGFHGGFGGGVWIVEREVPVIIEREVVVREVPAAPPVTAPPPAPPRKPYVIGSTYASLPGGCMKWIEPGASYYHCGGEWYRQVGGGRYQAVAHP